MNHWVHNLDPVIIGFGAIQVRWYGFMYLVGFVVGYLLFVRRYRQGLFRLKPMDAQNLITYIMLGMMIGARLVYVLVYNPIYYWMNPSEIPQIWLGGLSFHGALLGFVGAVLLYRKHHGLKFFEIMDSVVFGSSQGIFWGRMGNFINGELYGRTTDVPWGIIFPDGGSQPRHPSQLYQGLLEGLMVFLVLHLIQWREQRLGFAPKALNSKSQGDTKKKGKPEPIVWKRTGIISASFLIIYGIGRFIVEFFREPDAQLGYFFGWITMGQILCLFMVIVGAYLLQRNVRRPIPSEYSPPVIES